MALLTRWREPQRLRSLMRAWEPERMMREMFPWDPLAEMQSVGRLRPEEWFSPDVDLKETADGFVFQVDLPGVQEKDLDISVSGRRLTISGKREEEREEREGERFHAYERAYGAFSRSFTLPEDVDPDKIEAELKDGELRVRVPKTPASQAKKIPVQSAKSLQSGAEGQRKGETKKAA